MGLQASGLAATNALFNKSKLKCRIFGISVHFLDVADPNFELLRLDF